MAAQQTRTPFIGGNWKCNGSRGSIVDLVAGLNKADFSAANVEAVVAPAMLHLDMVHASISGRFKVAAQNVSRTGNGAYTGEISPEMVVDSGLEWVIIGHSERRKYYGDTDEVVGEKVANAQAHGLKVIACIGESKEQREANETLNVVFRQVRAIADRVADWSGVVLAYEPVWAIGTGLTASPEQAQEVHAAIRGFLADNYGASVAANTRIIYGGSVKPKNCESLIVKPDVDGFLVGGASLKPDAFEKILQSPAKNSKL